MTEVSEINEIQEDELNANVKPLWLKSLAAAQNKNHGYAVKLLQTVLKDTPGFLDGRRLLRQCAVSETSGQKRKSGFFGGGFGSMKFASAAKKDPLGTLPQLEAELAKAPYSPELNDILFDICVKLGMEKTAAFALETIRKGHPDQTKYLHKLAHFYLDHHQCQTAAEVYRDIIEQDSTDSAAIKGEKDATARASMEKQNWSEDTSMRDLLRNRDEAEQMEQDSRTGLTRDQLEARRDKLVAQYAEDQNNQQVVKDLANIYEQLEDWPNAYQFYDWAYNLSDGDVALRAKAEKMHDQAEAQEMRDLEARATENPDDQEVKAQLEERRKKQIEEAVNNAKTRVEQNPTDPMLRYEYGKALFDAGNYSDAIPQLQQAKRNPHIQSKVLLLLGRTFKAKGMLDMGVKQLDSALEDLVTMNSDKKEVLYEKGLLHDEMGDREKALECFKEIYEVDYGYLDIAERVESSYTAN